MHFNLSDGTIGPDLRFSFDGFCIGSATTVGQQFVRLHTRQPAKTLCTEYAFRTAPQSSTVIGCKRIFCHTPKMPNDVLITTNIFTK